MADEALVTPLDPNAPPQPEITPKDGAEPAQAQSSGLPDELIQLPAMQALLAGSPAAVSARIKDFSNKPEAKLLAQNKDLLAQAGMGFYRSLSGEYGSVFNQFHLHPDDLLAADKQGKLLQIAPPVEVVDSMISKSGKNNPIFARNSIPGGPAAARSTQAPPQFASGKPVGASDGSSAPTTLPAPLPVAPAPASLQRKAYNARLANVGPGGPTTGAKPGGGRLLNQVLKSVI